MILWIKADEIDERVDQRARFIALDEGKIIARLCGTDIIVEVNTNAVCGFEVCDGLGYKFDHHSTQRTEVSCRNCEE